MKLVAQNIGKSYSQRKILTDISFSVNSGQSVAITGPNGSGKTTLIRILCLLTRADRGVVYFEQNGKKNSNYQKSIAMVGPYIQLYDELTAYENLEFCSRMINNSADKDNIIHQIEQVGLIGRARDFVKTYSSGMKQRLKYAFALMANPDVLFIDEPTSNLDKKGIDIIYNIMNHYKKEKILVFATNDEVDLKFADQVVIIGG
jgi:heme exporter protein A